MTNISPHLWYADKAHEAGAFYASIFPQSLERAAKA
jgi:predicted 3-demethylubiquinone-9 3-methyltransferase (glyoxalase superfamily)